MKKAPSALRVNNRGAELTGEKKRAAEELKGLAREKENEHLSFRRAA